MKETRSYKINDEVLIGDVVCLFEGAYGTGIITHKWVVSRCTGDVQEWVRVERVHCRSTPMGQLYIGVERVDLTLERIREMLVFVTGLSGDIDNRKDD